MADLVPTVRRHRTPLIMIADALDLGRRVRHVRLAPARPAERPGAVGQRRGPRRGHRRRSISPSAPASGCTRAARRWPASPRWSRSGWSTLLAGSTVFAGQPRRPCGCRAACRPAPPSPPWCSSSPAAPPGAGCASATTRPRRAPPRARRGCWWSAPATAGKELIGSMLRDPNRTWHPVGLLDDDPYKRHRRIRNVPVLGATAQARRRGRRRPAPTTVIIAIPSADADTVQRLSAAAHDAGVTVKVLPSTTQLLTDHVGIRDIRDINLTDVLGRNQLDTDIDAIAGYLTGRRVLVTGAGGSIGSELCRQIHRFAPAELMMLDRDESALHAVQLSIHGRALLDSDDVVLCDIRDARAVTDDLPRTAAPRWSSTPRRSSTCRCSSSTPPRPSRPTSSAPTTCSRPPELVAGRAVRQHLHRQGGQPDQRARLLQADRRAADRRPRLQGRRAPTSRSASATCSAAAARC